MKKTSFSLFFLLGCTSLLANTTMCFKENHKSMSTIEQTPLDGGQCAGTNSVANMKAKGWLVDDIKITTTKKGMNYVYIFKTKQQNSSNSFESYSNTSENQEQMEQRILAKLQKQKEEEKIAKQLEEKIKLQQAGKSLYVNKCQSCHGANGELEARGYSRPLDTLSLEQMQDAIRGYTNGTYNRGLAISMRPIANSISSNDVEEIYSYLSKINQDK